MLAFQIKADGIDIEWKEPIYKSDGMNGRIQIGEHKRKIRGILVNENAAQGSNMAAEDSGRKNHGSHKLTILFEPWIRPEYLTEFYTKDKKQYRIVEVVNVDNLDLYYSITCIQTNVKMKGYKNHETRQT